MAKGACNCGAVAFEITADLTDVIICHCSICRRFSGANGVAVLVAPTEAFCWLKGEEQITTWNKPDADWIATFCSVCGSSLPGKNDETHMFIPAGLLMSDDTLHVAHHIFVDSKAHWDQIGDPGVQHPGPYGS